MFTAGGGCKGGESPCTVAVGEGGAVGDVRVPASPKIIDVDPISCKPGGADDLVKDQPQIE
jgi:hypothetical protein